MIIHTESIGEVKQVCDFFSIPINTAEVEISFPYAMELKTINGVPAEVEGEFTFEEFKRIWKIH